MIRFQNNTLKVGYIMCFPLNIFNLSFYQKVYIDIKRHKKVILILQKYPFNQHYLIIVQQ